MRLPHYISTTKKKRFMKKNTLIALSGIVLLTLFSACKKTKNSAPPAPNSLTCQYNGRSISFENSFMQIDTWTVPFLGGTITTRTINIGANIDKQYRVSDTSNPSIHFSFDDNESVPASDGISIESFRLDSNLLSPVSFTGGGPSIDFFGQVSSFHPRLKGIVTGPIKLYNNNNGKLISDTTKMNCQFDIAN